MKNLDYNIEGADCGRFSVKPKSSPSGKMHTENHRSRTWRVAEVMGWPLLLNIFMSQN